MEIAIINWSANEGQIERVKSIISESVDNFTPEYVEFDLDDKDINKKVVSDARAVLVVIGDNILHVLANNREDCYLNEKETLVFLYNWYYRYRSSFRFCIVTNTNWECYLAHYTCMNLFVIVRHSYVPDRKLLDRIIAIYESDSSVKCISPYDRKEDFLYCRVGNHLNYNYENEFKKVVNNSESNSFVSVFAPETIKVNNFLLIQVYIYKDSDHNIVVETAKRSDDNNTKERHQVLLDYNINKSDIIDVALDLYPRILFVQNRAIWMEKYALASFEVYIPSDFEYDKLHAKILISVNAAIICQMNFATKIIKKSIFSRCFNIITKFIKKSNVSEEKTEENKLVKIISRCFKKVFISYSHKDADKIKYLAEAYRAIGVDYFYDRHSLQGGDVFDEKIKEAIQSSDLFILCWSKNAAQSNYIKKEIDTALPLAYPQIRPQEAAPLSIYPIRMEPSVALPENMKHIYNFAEM